MFRAIAGLAAATLLSGMTPAPAWPVAELAEKWGLSEAGIMVIELNTGRQLGLRADRPFKAERLAGLPVVASVYRRLADQELTLTQRVGSDEDLYGPGVRPWTPLSPMPLHEALQRVALEPASAVPTLAEVVGPEGAASALSALAMKKTRFLPEGPAETTAEDLARLVAKATRAEVVNPGASDELLELLSTPADGFSMPRASLRAVRTAYRLSESAGTAREVAWVQERGHHYVVAVLTDLPVAEGNRRIRGFEADLHQAIKQASPRDWARLAIRRMPSHNHGERDGQAIDTIVLHHTVIGSSAEDVGDYFRRADIEASSHYTVAKDGTIVQHVDDCQAAWHAGASEFKGRPRVNKFSIGIEIVNKGDGRDPYPDRQYRALARLMAQLMDEYGIGWDRVTGHKDVALPRGRKSDPSPNFSYERLRREVASVRSGR